MRLLWFLCLVAICAPWPSFAQQVLQVRWPSKNTAPPIVFDDDQRNWLPMLRLGLGSLSEESIIGLGLTQAPAVGVNASDAARLQKLFAAYYARIRQAETFRAIPSALPYCLSETRPTNGLATVYIPAKVTPTTRTIIFLHGYGGSLVAYVHYMASLFPNDVIIFPAYGIAPDEIPFAYLAEAQTAVARRVKLNAKPTLIGLSAGGVGLCRVYAARPESFERLICLGTIPPGDATAKFGPAMKIAFVSGRQEFYVADGSFGRQMKALKGRVPKLNWQTIPGADYYFLLSHEAETRKALSTLLAP